MPRFKWGLSRSRRTRSKGPGVGKSQELPARVVHPQYPESSMDLLPLRCLTSHFEPSKLGLGSLPLEIVEQILDYLDVPALNAARFVSPTWWGVIMLNTRALVKAISCRSAVWDKCPCASDFDDNYTYPTVEELQIKSVRQLGRTFDRSLSGLCMEHMENQWRVRFRETSFRLKALNNQQLECVRVSLSGRLVAGILTENGSQLVVVYSLQSSRELFHIVSVPLPLPGARPCTIHIVEGSNFSNYWAIELFYLRYVKGVNDPRYHFQAIYKDACGVGEVPVYFPIEARHLPKHTPPRPEWIPGRFQEEAPLVRSPLLGRKMADDWTLLENIPLPEHGNKHYWLAHHRPTTELFLIRHTPKLAGMDNHEIIPIKLLSRPSHDSTYKNLAVAPELDFLHDPDARTIHIAILWTTGTSRRTILFTYALRFMRFTVLCRPNCDLPDHEISLPSWWEVNLQGQYKGPLTMRCLDPQTGSSRQMELLLRLWREGPIQGKRVCSFPHAFGGVHGSMQPPLVQRRPSQPIVSAGMRVLGDGYWRILLWGAPEEGDGPQTLQMMRLVDLEFGRAANCKQLQRHNWWLRAGEGACACGLHDRVCDVILPGMLVDRRGENGEKRHQSNAKGHALSFRGNQ